MVKGGITQEDMYKIKLEISKEQTELRHEDRKNMQTAFLEIDDLKTDGALFKQSIASMEKHVAEIKEIFLEHLRKDEAWRNTLLDKLDNKYAGKWTEKILVTIGSTVGTAIIGAIMYLILRH